MTRAPRHKPGEGAQVKAERERLAAIERARADDEGFAALAACLAPASEVGPAARERALMRLLELFPLARLTRLTGDERGLGVGGAGGGERVERVEAGLLAALVRARAAAVRGAERAARHLALRLVAWDMRGLGAELALALLEEGEGWGEGEDRLGLMQLAAHEDARVVRVAAERLVWGRGLAELAAELEGLVGGELVRNAAVRAQLAARALAVVAGDEATRAGGARLVEGLVAMAVLDEAQRVELVARAAVTRGPELLSALALLAEDGAERVRERALEALLGLLAEGERVVAAIPASARARAVEVAPSVAARHPDVGVGLLVAMYAGLGRSEHKARLAHLAAMARLGAEREVGERVLEEVGGVAPGRSGLTRRLVEELEARSGEEQLALFEVLGAFGDASALPALDALSGGLFRARTVKAAARAAASAIRARGAAEGALSVAGEEGGLALVEAPGRGR